MKDHTEEMQLITNSAAKTATTQHHASYLLFILLISILAFIVLATDLFVDVNSDARRILHFADTVLCVLFFGDFLLCLFKSKHKLNYMATWGWLDLISSIPTIEVLRFGRAARVARVLRVLRGIRSARILMRFILEWRAKVPALAAALASIVVVAVASVTILHVERAAGDQAKIRTAEDALWWSMVTLTTVGYGDLYPVTTEGRVVAIMLMVVGVGIVGTWAGIAAAWFMATAHDQHSDQIDDLHRELKELRQLLESRR